MDEYIKRDDVLRYISKGLTNPNEKERFGWEAIVIMGEIQFMPAVDVAEVIRCKDCKHRIDDEDFMCKHYCLKRPSNGGRFCEDNDFCSYGERREP